MAWRRLAHVIGAVVTAAGAAMVAPIAISLIYREFAEAGQIGLAAILTTGFGLLAWRSLEPPGELTTREGFAIVGLSWIAMAIFGTLPYLLTGEIGSFTDAFFETAAGFTTTGASIAPDPGAFSHGILVWRALTQWLGGMGIIVLSIAILPLLGLGGVELARAEAPGVSPDRLTPRFRETAKRLWYLYAAFTLVEALLLWAGDMTLFEGFAHALTTMSTGGFSTSAGSLGAFSAYSQWIVIVFMIAAGASFALHFRGLRKPREYARSGEFRLYIGVMAAAFAVAAVGIWSSPFHDSIRDSLFTVVSIVTTTGYATTDFGLWPVALQILVLGLMFVGGMTGSTGGSVKPYRLGVLYQASRADLRRVIHPRAMFPVRFGRDIVPDKVVESIQSFFLLYMFIFMTGTLLFGITLGIWGSDFDIVSAASAVASALGNVGPGLSDVGPTASYVSVPAVGKWLLAFLMIVGRLEIFPVVLLLSPELWRR